MKLAVRLAAVAVVMVAVSAPLQAQTGSSSTWHNQKMSDMQSHERNQDFDSRASGHYDMAVAEAQTIQSLVDVEDRSKRQEKKLQKSYARAVEHLEQAIEAEPEFVGARLMLGAIHYKMKEYEAAREAYQGVLEVDPENQDAQAYLNSVNWYLERNAESDTEPASSGG